MEVQVCKKNNNNNHFVKQNCYLSKAACIKRWFLVQPVKTRNVDHHIPVDMYFYMYKKRKGNITVFLLYYMVFSGLTFLTFDLE